MSADRWEVADALVESTLAPLSRLVMFALLRRADTETAVIPAHFSPSLARLAKDTGLAKSSVAEHLNRLETAGWVVRVRSSTKEQLADHATTVYMLRIPEDAACPSRGHGVVRLPDRTRPRRGQGSSSTRTRPRPGDGHNHFSLSRHSGSSPANEQRGIGSDVVCTCDAGWIDRDNLVHCPRCRPHLNREAVS